MNGKKCHTDFSGLVNEILINISYVETIKKIYATIFDQSRNTKKN